MAGVVGHVIGFGRVEVVVQLHQRKATPAAGITALLQFDQVLDLEALDVDPLRIGEAFGHQRLDQLGAKRDAIGVPSSRRPSLAK